MAEDERCDLLAIDVATAERLRTTLPSVEDLELRALRVKGLSDPSRLRLAIALRDGGELCVCDLAWLAERQDKIVSHHLRLLRTAGLVRSRKDGRMVLYSLTGVGESLLDDVMAPEVIA
ncbi:metalloregulator ArsR/SmtB family transcription factor [Conexibacter sp. W3-3-2]|uniref:ArsR/SmtB family transcription factor n=1 Tax=Conexibacter sp. W3-3-2 TaxID=2675227 RepID=UPI0012B995A3|nr:metalloregulator ArsR/SmtB family transcription factor [Conexibacter sp. W3-3-2]MTD47532.1 metalloregulator ArsR/SmtB family transcription factor [Conexibacter sp. W3-3-2]